MTRTKVLVVDDDPAVQTYLSEFLRARNYSVACLDSGEGVLDQIDTPDPPSVILLDLMLPRHDGLSILSQLQTSGRAIPVIVLSGMGQARTVVNAMRMGAADYLVKPFEDDELERSIRSAVEIRPSYVRLQSPQHPSASYLEEDGSFENSADPRISRIRDVASRVADTDAPVLILGETGVGKEVLAKYIHNVSGRKGHPFVKVNCAAVPTELLESELFGYERGAFTGAVRDKPGKFELAGKGTILLDEIGEMSALLQAKLLHVLQDNECYRLGALKPTRLEARVLASTNRHLEEAVAKGEFRQDLFFRLNVIRLELPPLRSRACDIPALCDHFLGKYAARYQRDPACVPDELMDAFLRYSWPGNVRQLENVIRRFVILPEPELALADLVRSETLQAEGRGPAETSLRELSAFAAEQTERELVLRTLDEVNWNRKEAAKRLHICYKSLLNKLHRWQIPGRGHRESNQSHAATADTNHS